MALSRLQIRQFRNLINVDLSPGTGVNLIYGANGSGKTSLLEAINVLALGRSFRSHKYKALINHQSDQFMIFGRVESLGGSIPLGIQRSNSGELLLKAQGQAIESIADLAQYLPVLVINSDTFSLLDGTPKDRRHFIDWLVFHVEHQFFAAWKTAQRCLKHRNSLLRRDRMDPFELSTWDQELVRVSELLNQFRLSVVSIFVDRFNHLANQLESLKGIEIDYYRGWNSEQDYDQVLAHSLDRDKRLGSTHYGIHRADLRITIDGKLAAEVLSRGQQKLLVCALKIAQGQVFNDLKRRKPLYLIDDLPAELDREHRQILVNWLHSLDTQVYISGVELSALETPWRDKPNVKLKMFHVEQGRVIEQP